MHHLGYQPRKRMVRIQGWSANQFSGSLASCHHHTHTHTHTHTQTHTHTRARAQARPLLLSTACLHQKRHCIPLLWQELRLLVSKAYCQPQHQSLYPETKRLINSIFNPPYVFLAFALENHGRDVQRSKLAYFTTSINLLLKAVHAITSNEKK